MFFSVKQPIKINKKAYHTCICYPVTETIKATVLDLEKEGKAVTYKEAVFFCNGKLLEKKKEVVVTKPAKKSKKAEVTEEAFNEVGSLADEAREF